MYKDEHNKFVGEPGAKAPLEVKVDPFSLEALILWLEKQPGETEYNYLSPGGCLICSYLSQAVGFQEPRVTETTFRDGLLTEARNPLPARWNDIVVARPWTCGAALSRARNLLSERNR